MNKKLRVILASLMTLGMLLFSYWVTNQRYAVSGETALMRNMELIKGWFKPHINPMSDSVLLVNVSYDPVLIGVDDSYGMHAGYDRITDRHKLLQLLMELDRKKDYKYIIVRNSLYQVSHDMCGLGVRRQRPVFIVCLPCRRTERCGFRCFP